jgi:large subunit ribosomal protein L4
MKKKKAAKIKKAQKREAPANDVPVVDVYSLSGKKVDKFKLSPEVFNAEINKPLMSEASIMYLANKRQGTASTKTRGEVSGGGKKPWRQKGTGRARAGSIRSPLWRHGGVVFGPHPRDFSYNVPEKIKTIALKSALCAKLKDNNLMVLDTFTLTQAKTKEAVKVFGNLNLVSKASKRPPSVLLLLEKTDPTAKRALRNISFLNFNLAKDTNTYEVMAHTKLLITKDGLKELTQRLKK